MKGNIVWSQIIVHLDSGGAGGEPNLSGAESDMYTVHARSRISTVLLNINILCIIKVRSVTLLIYLMDEKTLSVSFFKKKWKGFDKIFC